MVDMDEHIKKIVADIRQYQVQAEIAINEAIRYNNLADISRNHEAFKKATDRALTEYENCREAIGRLCATVSSINT